MKTHNCHPFWYNQPLRLTSDQTQKPNLVLDDFFECYHLNEVRKTMWQLVTEAVSSPRSVANDPHERNNFMFFYEKMESLVEAAWIMNRGSGPATNWVGQVPEQENNERKDTIMKASSPTRFSKPARLIEKANTEPAAVIAEVFSEVQFKDLQEYLLPTWLRVAVINTQSPYSAGTGREILFEFYDHLLSFVEALYVNSETIQGNISAYFTDQKSNPTLIINEFFQQFTIDYLRRELCDFVEAGIGYEGNYPNGFSPWQAWMAYNHMLCLIEAAYQLYINQQLVPIHQTLVNKYH